MPERSENGTHGYQLFMLALCVFALVALAVERAVPLPTGFRPLFAYADFAVCIVFFGDFLWSLATAKDRWRYLRTWGWVDLVSSIPTVDLLRVGRAARVLRIVRVMRGVKAARIVGTFVAQRRAESAAMAATFLGILVLFFGSAAVLHFEADEGNIRGPEDAAWWAVVTMTTTGYGDRVPVTPEGRLVGVFLMFSGVLLLGTLSGLAASWFLSPIALRNRSEIEALAHEVARLREALERAAPGVSPGPSA
jgi:voltage-gated potassium channel